MFLILSSYPNRSSAHVMTWSHHLIIIILSLACRFSYLLRNCKVGDLLNHTWTVARSADRIGNRRDWFFLLNNNFIFNLFDNCIHSIGYWLRYRWPRVLTNIKRKIITMSPTASTTLCCTALQVGVEFHAIEICIGIISDCIIIFESG